MRPSDGLAPPEVQSKASPPAIVAVQGPVDGGVAAGGRSDG
jgi:hypothetical protein